MPRFLDKEAFKNRRRMDAALAIPVFAIFLLMSPFISVFKWDIHIFGAPLTVIYTFGSWLGLVLVTRQISRTLPESRSKQDRK